MSEFQRIVVRIDPELVDLIPGFLENRWKDVAAIKAALARGDLEYVLGIGHRMKGCGGGYGFPVLSDVGAAIENAAQRLNHEGVLQAVSKLEDYLTRLEIAYD